MLFDVRVIAALPSVRDGGELVNRSVFHGCLPALMTPCDEAGDVNLDALVATAKRLMAAGMSGVVYCGSMGDWPLLTDEQRQHGVERLVDAGIPVVVGTGAQSPGRAAAHAAHAASVGAAGLMLIPRVLSRGTSPAAQRAHFAGVLDAAPNLPSIIYNSPYYGFETRAELFFDLRAEHPNLVGYKEFGGKESLSYAAEHITSESSDLDLLVGVDTQVVHGIVYCGAVGVITGIGNVMPAAVLTSMRLARAAANGDPTALRLALELEQALGPLAEFDEGADLVLFYKHLAVLAGHHDYTHHVNSTDSLTQSQRRYATDQWERFCRWWASWDGCAHGGDR
jgi:1-pyrroline-4-hydroxy-2-carboxylate deaminase